MKLTIRSEIGSDDALGRWTGYDVDDASVGVAIARRRPDNRVFVTHQIENEEAFEPLLRAAVDAIDGPVHVTIQAGSEVRVTAVRSLGFDLELVSAKYDVPFEGALRALRTRRGRRSFTIVSATDVDPDALFLLDTQLRNDVPGNDGWTGNRDWFDDEMNSPDFDPDGYCVAVDSVSNNLVGLCRMWRNPVGPALGMLGVTAARRTGYVAHELLVEALTRSSAWGWPTFGTHTARPGLQRRLERVGAAQTGGFQRFIRP